MKHLHILSDFNVESLANYMRFDSGEPHLSVGSDSMAPVHEVLNGAVPSLNKNHIDYLLVWTRPQGVLPGIAELLAGRVMTASDIESEVALFVEGLARASKVAGVVLVPLWALPASARGLGLIDCKTDRGLALAALRANYFLTEQLKSYPLIYCLDTGRWIASLSEPAFDPKLWFLGKIPFGNQMIKKAVQETKAAIRAHSGGSKKLLILDLDGVMWGGIVGEEGWQALNLGGHDAVGEALVDFQKKVKALKERGVLLAIVSKNDESVALEAIDRHPEMILRRDDFVAWRINWRNKSENIVSICEQLNLKTDAVVFIDDTPQERAWVRESLPDVEVPEWGDDPLLFPSQLEALTSFDSPYISEEDLNRTQQYHDEGKRVELKKTALSYDDWLEKLDIKVHVERLSEINLKRAVQLLNKTNQMNLSGRRSDEKEYLSWSREKNKMVWVFRVSDRLGDSGVIGLLSIERDGQKVVVRDFIMSCRVFGRRIEHVMLRQAAQYAETAGATGLELRYQPTEKNGPCLDFLKNCGATEKDGYTFIITNKALGASFSGLTVVEAGCEA